MNILPDQRVPTADTAQALPSLVAAKNDRARHGADERRESESQCQSNWSAPYVCKACVRLHSNEHRQAADYSPVPSGKMRTRSGHPLSIRIPGGVILEYRMMVRSVLPGSVGARDRSTRA